MTQTRNKLLAIALCTVGCTMMLFGGVLLTSDRRFVFGLVSCGALLVVAGYIQLRRS